MEAPENELAKKDFMGGRPDPGIRNLPKHVGAPDPCFGDLG